MRFFWFRLHSNFKFPIIQCWTRYIYMSLVSGTMMIKLLRHSRVFGTVPVFLWEKGNAQYFWLLLAIHVIIFGGSCFSSHNLDAYSSSNFINHAFLLVHLNFINMPKAGILDTEDGIQTDEVHYMVLICQ